MRKLVVVLLILPLVATAQKERADIRKGNSLFDLGKYTEAEVEYKRALEKKADSYEATFNLGGAVYKQGRNDEAEKVFKQVTESSTTPENQSKSLYNLGNAQLKQRKLDEAIESYKSSLRINPSDQQAKFNLAYAQKLKKEDEKKDDNKDDKKDQDQDQNQDPNQNQEPPKQDPKEDKKDDKKDEQPQQQPKPDAQRMLNAIQAAEDKTKEKVDKQKAEAVGQQTGKQW